MISIPVSETLELGQSVASPGQESTKQLVQLSSMIEGLIDN